MNERAPEQTSFIRRQIALAKQQCAQEDKIETFFKKFAAKTVAASLEPAAPKKTMTALPSKSCVMPGCTEPAPTQCKRCLVSYWCSKHVNKEELWRKHHVKQCGVIRRTHDRLAGARRMYWTINHSSLPLKIMTDGVAEGDFQDSWQCVPLDFILKCQKRVTVAVEVSAAAPEASIKPNSSVGVYNPHTNSWESQRAPEHGSSILHGFYGTAFLARLTRSCLHLEPKHLYFAACEHMRTNWKSWFNTANLFGEEHAASASELRRYLELGNVGLRDKAEATSQTPPSTPDGKINVPKKDPMVWTTESIHSARFFTDGRTLNELVLAIARHAIPKVAWDPIERLPREQILAYAWMVFYCADVSRMIWQGPPVIADACVQALRTRNDSDCIHETNLHVETLDEKEESYTLNVADDIIFGFSVAEAPRPTTVENSWKGVDGICAAMESCSRRISSRMSRIFVKGAATDPATRASELESWPEDEVDEDDDNKNDDVDKPTKKPWKTQKLRFMTEVIELALKSEDVRSQIASIAKMFRKPGEPSFRTSFVSQLVCTHEEAEKKKEVKTEEVVDPPLAGLLMEWMGRRWGNIRAPDGMPMTELQMTTFFDYDFVWRGSKTGEARNVTLRVGFCGFEYNAGTRGMCPSHIVSLHVRGK